VIDDIYKLFRETLPDIIRDGETVLSILGEEGNHIIERRKNGKLNGVSVINENTIYLLCVEKSSQNQGVGTELLKRSEEHIASNGFNKVILGLKDDYIMPGAPMKNSMNGVRAAFHFFVKHGYRHSWGDTGCIDLDQRLEDFSYNEHKIGDTINGIIYRWANIGDIAKVLECTADAEQEFIKYYDDKELYTQDSNTSVLIAEKDNKVLGTLIVSIDAGYEGMGSLACIATVPVQRGKGIAANMMMLGTRYLKDMGLIKSHLSYTYTDIVNIYHRAGYKICMEYFMGEKQL
jgi:GNAT superfamily N-acetyltransferase